MFANSGATIIDISKWTDNKIFYFLNLIWRGIISGKINLQKTPPLVFNGQCNFAYKLSPWIKSSVVQIELIHAFNSFSYIRIPFLRFYNKSVTVSNSVVEAHRELYSGLGIPIHFIDSFKVINTRIELPQKITRSDYHTTPLTILYVGRSTNEKRPWILVKVAEQFRTNADISFLFAGDIHSSLTVAPTKNCIFLGDIVKDGELDSVYRRSHVIVIPSSSESGPLVLMEAMARGVVPVSTPVGICPTHIKNGLTGFLTTSIESSIVVEEVANYINLLHTDRDLLKRMGTTSAAYAYDHFGMDDFNQQYKELLSIK